MKDKDIAEKILEDYPDVFADIVNGFLFNGNEVVKPEELEDMQLRSAYRAEQKLHDMERDVAKRWKKNGIRIACVGFENQTAPDSRMVLRVLGYDGAEYRAQCLKENRNNAPYPVITIVLYFGYEQRWTAAKSLYEAVSVPDELKPFVTDTKINVFEVAWLKDEQVAKFKSDFRIVADYFVQKQENGDYIPSPEKLHHVQETLQLLSVMTNDHRFEEAYSDNPEEGGVQNMCDVLDRAERRGAEKKAREAAINLYKMGMAAEDIAKVLNEALSTVQQWLGIASA